jgi:hypothetical protein
VKVGRKCCLHSPLPSWKDGTFGTRSLRCWAYTAQRIGCGLGNTSVAMGVPTVGIRASNCQHLADFGTFGSKDHDGTCAAVLSSHPCRKMVLLLMWLFCSLFGRRNDWGRMSNPITKFTPQE